MKWTPVLRNSATWFVAIPFALVLICGVVYLKLASTQETDDPRITSEQANLKRDEKQRPKRPKQASPQRNTRKFIRYEGGMGVVASTVHTNASGYIVEDYTMENGEARQDVRPPEPIFKNASDQVIALAISTPPGESMPPLPDLTGIERDFKESLHTPIIIEASDSQEVKELKRRVMEVREEMAELVQNGGSFAEALLEHQDEMNRLADSRAMAVQEMQQIYAEDGLSAAQAFARRVNEKFKREGIPEIPVIGKDKDKKEKNPHEKN